MRYFFILSICLVSFGVMGQQKTNQYILIVRSKEKIDAPEEQIKANMQHWGAWMGELGKSGKIAGGYRPGTDGLILKGKDKKEGAGAYAANGEVVSSFLIINAADMDEAKHIAAGCPTFELGGSVEVRPVQNTGR